MRYDNIDLNNIITALFLLLWDVRCDGVIPDLRILML